MADRFNASRLKSARARALRLSMTDAETMLWQKLRASQMGAAFRRQHPAGNYVLDFFAPAIGLAIELDGGQHALPATSRHDATRTQWLEARGVRVLRFWNSDVQQNLSGVTETIFTTIAELKEQQRMTPIRRWRADLPLSGASEKSTSDTAAQR